MHRISGIAIILATVLFYSCNNPAQQPEHAHDNAPAAAMTATSTDVRETTSVSPAFSSLDPGAATAIHATVALYLAVKNALASDNAAQAAEAAGALRDALKKLDKSRLTAEQKKAYDKVEEAIREQAALIAGAAGDIGRQRNSFYPLSESVYALTKQFGGGRTLYHDYCPMARDNQGALWISEQKDIRNPYFGSGMLTCGTVEAVIQ